MGNTKGIIEFEYLSNLKRIEYNLSLSPGYAGLPLMSIKDKNNHYYSFTRDRNQSEWHALGKTPKWPADFLMMLYIMFEEKYQEGIK